MTCGDSAAWDIIKAATDMSVLAGVLAGFLIASAAVLFASGNRYVPHTIALMASGVPVLALASYLFSAISGSRAHDSERCAQVWSQGLVATAMLAIGGAVLVCGLGWVLISYTEDFEHMLLEKRVAYEALVAKKLVPTIPKTLTDPKAFKEVVLKRRVLLVSLNGWLVVAANTTAAVLLICADTAYIKSGNYKSVDLSLLVTFITVGIGLYFGIRSAHTAIRRTFNARDKLTGSSVPPREGSYMRDLVLILPAAATAAWLAGYTADWLTITVGVIGTAVLTSSAREAYRRWKKSRPTKARYSSNNAEGSDKFDVGRLHETAYNIVLFAIVGTLFAALATQKPMLAGIRNFVTLFLTGLYAPDILLGLSRSTAAGDRNYWIPRWMIKDDATTLQRLKSGAVVYVTRRSTPWRRFCSKLP